ncbi:MAG: SRPBCC family protein [Nitrosopumilus sp.]|nr:SRPBCC family protein [Nitrosopumilus sp.]NNL59129.1 SRPBCC family protein [Nitrosopumilus sp.]
MSVLNLEKNSILPQEILFKLSTDVSNFHKVMPEYFESLKIIEDSPTKKVVLESIRFIGKKVHVKTLHEIIFPNIHIIKILTGDLKGTEFYETYTATSNGTNVTITIKLQLNGILKFIPFLHKIIFKKMNAVMDEFLCSTEKYAKTHSLIDN